MYICIKLGKSQNLTLNNLFTKKTLFTLLSVCFAVTISANNGDGIFYVKKGTKVAGLEKVYVPSLKVKKNVFYVKEKTVFHAEKNTNVKVVYISNTKEVKKDEKLITAFKKPKLQVQQKNNKHIQLKPTHKLPFKIGYFNFYSNNLAIVFSNIVQNAKTNTSFKNKIFYTYSSVSYAVSIPHNYTVNNFSYKTSKFTTNILNANFGRPPPFV